MTKTCLITTSDDTYLKYTTPLINSCNSILGDKVDLMLRYVSTKPLDNHIRDKVDIVIEETNALCTKRTHFGGGFDSEHPRNTSSSIRDKLVSKRQLYCIHSKYMNCKLGFNMGYDRIIISDADTIIRRDILEHSGMSNECDMMMKKTVAGKRNGYKYPHVFEEGFFVIYNNINSNRFIDKILDGLDNETTQGTIHVDSDTILIGNLLHEEDYNYAELPEELKDETLRDSSYVWSGRGSSKTSSAYLREVERYTY